MEKNQKMTLVLLFKKHKLMARDTILPFLDVGGILKLAAASKQLRLIIDSNQAESIKAQNKMNRELSDAIAYMLEQEGDKDVKKSVRRLELLKKQKAFDPAQFSAERQQEMTLLE